VVVLPVLAHAHGSLFTYASDIAERNLTGSGEVAAGDSNIPYC